MRTGLPLLSMLFGLPGYPSFAFTIPSRAMRIYSLESVPIARPQKPLASSSTTDEDVVKERPAKTSKESLGNAPRLLLFLWRGITLPFPMLRNLAPDTDIKGIFSLQECLLALAAYIALGGIAYTRIFERWTLVDALYFSVVSLTTVGYGDLAPSNHPSKFFTCIFGMGGVAFLGIAIATIGSSLVEAELDAVQRAKKLSRKRLISIFEGMPHVLDHLRKNKKRKEEIQEKRRRLIAKKLTSRMIPDWTKSIWKFLPRLLPSLTLMFVGGLIMGNIEKWSRANSIYYSIITAGTQGYGDFSPQSRNGRLWGILFIPMAVAAAGEFLGNVANVIVERRQHARNEKIIHRDLNLRYLREMDENGNGQVSRLEFVQFMLKEMGIVEQELLDELNEQFDHLDATNDGVLEVDDLKLMAELSGVNVINATDENAGETVVDLI